MGSGLKVLHIEDDFGDAMLLQHALYDADAIDLDLQVVRTLREARQKLSKSAFDLIIADLRLPDSSDPKSTIDRLRGDAPDAPLLVLTGAFGMNAEKLGSDVTVLDKNAFFHRRDDAKTQALLEQVRGAMAPQPAAVDEDDDDALIL